MKLKKSVSDKMLPAGDEKLKRSISDKVVLKPKKKNDHENKTGKNSRFLITVNVLGSSGPIRFVVNQNDSVSGVIDAVLKLYAREKRLPALGSDADSFLLYPANAGMDGGDLHTLFGSSIFILLNFRLYLCMN